jgi:diguanylate cyclase (GGDEF)-like protein
VGYLVAVGKEVSQGTHGLLKAAAPFIAARIVHQKCRERAEQKNEEARLLGLMAEKCLTARTVDELLPLALEAAMCSLRARRGSIFLADEEQGRITARALRGAHAPICDTIESLEPGSVSHRVFYDRRPLLVRDTGQEPGLDSARQYPYATRSFVSVPLRENGHALGVLHLTEREGDGTFTPQDLLFLETLGLQASSAIRKARLEEEVRSLQVTSSTDHLTGVYNRRYLEDHLAVEFQRASRFNQPLAVAMLDLDGFKALNDELGHAAGDRMLKDVAATIGQQLRAVDVLARYGGDEFVLVLPGTGADGALKTVKKICSRFEHDGQSGSSSGDAGRQVTMSVGISAFPDSSADASELLHHADLALLQAKKSGRNAALLWSE